MLWTSWANGISEMWFFWALVCPLCCACSLQWNIQAKTQLASFLQHKLSPLLSIMFLFLFLFCMCFRLFACLFYIFWPLGNRLWQALVSAEALPNLMDFRWIIFLLLSMKNWRYIHCWSDFFEAYLEAPAPTSSNVSPKPNTMTTWFYSWSSKITALSLFIFSCLSVSVGYDSPGGVCTALYK